MATVVEPLTASAPFRGYRAVNSVGDEEAGYSIGDSTSSYASSTRRALKAHKIVGKAWSRSVEWLKARKNGEKAARLVDRGAHFDQSFGRWNIRRLKTQADLKKLVGSDPFHTLVNQSTFKIVFTIMGMYLSIVTVFAVVYKMISAHMGCHLELANVREAFLFSLETMSTVGYGTSDYLFDGCWIMLPVLSLQACMGLLIDAFLIGILFARLSRPQTRASTVVFTKHAVIRRVRGESYFMFQVGELRKHQLLETRVRCYAIRHERLTCNPPDDAASTAAAAAAAAAATLNGIDGSSSGRRSPSGEPQPESKCPDQVFFQCHSMRLQHPDDELGGNMLLVIPQMVVHRIDAWSPMMPPPRWNSSHGLVQWGLHQDRDMAQAPWECAEPPPPPGLKRGSSAGPPGEDRRNSAPVHSPSSQLSDQNNGGGLNSSAPGRRDSQYSSYWEESTLSELGGGTSERNANGGTDSIGYVHRFPDLLKRWDDVDGDRGTWYETMKRRLLKLEMERRAEEKHRAMRAAQEAQTAAAGARLARAGFKHSRRRASIMHVGAFLDSDAAVPSNADDFADSVRRMKDMSLGNVTEGCPMPSRSMAAALSRSQTPASRPGSPDLGLPSSANHAAASAAATAAAAAGAAPQGPRLSSAQWFAQEERKAVEAYIQDRELEVVVILEGTDTSTGSTVQARHSYCWEDIRWNHTFASVVSRGEDGACEVDFSKFHDIVEVPKDCLDHGFVQSYA